MKKVSSFVLFVRICNTKKTEEARTNTVIIKGKILQLNIVFIAKVNRQLISNKKHFRVSYRTTCKG